MHLTFKQVCDTAKINESTGRFYKNKFEEFFTSAGIGRHKKYDERAIDLLLTIAKLYSEGNDYVQVKMALEDIMGVPIANIAEQQSSNIYEVVQQDIENSFRQVFREEMEKRDSTILELRNELESVKETLMRLERQGEESDRTASDRDKEVMEAIRSMQLAIKQQNSRKWWHKIFGK